MNFADIQILMFSDANADNKKIQNTATHNNVTNVQSLQNSLVLKIEMQIPTDENAQNAFQSM